MKTTEKLREVISSGILLDDLVIIPLRGATDEEIAQEEELLCRVLSSQHRSMLKEWNGLGLEVLRLFGCGPATGEVGRINDFQLTVKSESSEIIAIGSDSSGFVYLEDGDGSIYSLDTRDGNVTPLSDSFESFICDLVFGADGEAFAGTEWIEELREYGLA